MKKFAFIVAFLAFGLFACRKEGASCPAPAKTDSVAASAASDTALILHPTPEQVSKARKVGNKHCPVSHEKIGGMGAPVQVIYKGDVVNLCCPGCIKDFEKSPASLVEAAKADTAPAD